MLAAKLADDSLYEKAQRLVWEGWHRHFHAFQYDTQRSGIIPPVGDPVTTLAILRKNIDTLRTWTEDARLRVAVEFIDPGNRSESVIDVIVDGRAGVLFERVELERSTIDSDARFAAEVWVDANRNGVRDSADERIAQQEPEGLQSVFEIPLSLLLAPGIAAQGPELVPESALLSDQQGRYALVVGAENKVEVRRVSIGALDGDMRVVEDGLRLDDRVIVLGALKTRPGAQVTPVTQEAAADGR